MKEEESVDEEEEWTMVEKEDQHEESFDKVAALFENVYNRLESVEQKVSEAQTGNPYDQSDEEQADEVDEDAHPVAHKDEQNRDGDEDKITKNESVEEDEELESPLEEPESEAAQGEELVDEDGEQSEEEPMSEESETEDDEQEEEVEEPVMSEKVTSVTNIFAEKSGRGDKTLLSALQNK